jgi:hypothetical protein
LPDIVIGQFTQRAQSLARARTGLELFADALSLVVGLGAENG